LRAEHAFRIWRNVPAPRRGEFVRFLSEELIAAKTGLARLVTIEAGNIATESRRRAGRFMVPPDKPPSS
jgi:aldehyde dehydrogenase (NAD+)